MEGEAGPISEEEDSSDLKSTLRTEVSMAVLLNMRGFMLAFAA